MDSGHNCEATRLYSDKYDAYFCDFCNKWLEEKCTDPECDYCTKRPNTPSRDEMKKLSEHEWIANIKRLEKLFKESYPNGTSTDFVRWVCSVYGYEFDAD